MPKKINLTPVLEIKIQLLIDQGLFDKQIQDQYGIPATWVKKYRTVHNISNNYYKKLDTIFDPKRDIITKIQLEECIKSGLTIDQTAEKLGVSKAVITTRQKMWNCSFNKAKFNIERYKELHNSGKSDKEIADLFGLTLHGIQDRKRHFDLERQDRNYTKITKEELEDLYVNKKLTIDIICKKLDKGQTPIYNLLKEYKIQFRREDGIQIRQEELQELINRDISIEEIARLKNTTSTSIKRAIIRYNLDIEELFDENNISLNTFTSLQKQLLYGGLLGDSHLSYSHINCHLKFCHGHKQKEYLEYKYKILKNFSQKHGISFETRLDKKTNNITESYEFRTTQSRIFTDLYSLFYNPIKYINRQVLNELDARGIAFWYMDDGYLHNNNEPVLCTDNFNNVDLCMIQNYFKEMWNINCIIRDDNRIIFKKEEGIKFIDLIRDYVLVPLFQYKLIAEYEKYKAKIFIKKQVWKNFTQDEVNKYIDMVFSYYRAKNFPYPTMEFNKIEDTLYRLENFNSSSLTINNTLKQKVLGHNICNFYMNHIWSIRNKNFKTAIEVFNNDQLLKKAIQKRMKYGDDMSNYGMRKTLAYANGAHRVSNFHPTVAKYIYDNYSGEGNVLDFSAGFGGRLLGAIASEKVKSYTGIEPCTKTYDALLKMTNDLTDKRIIIYKSPFEDCSLTELFDLAFSSPPYFNIEEYSYEDTQSFIRYKTKEEWRDKFLNILISKTYQLLKPNGYFIINIANVRTYKNLIDETLFLAQKIGFTYIKTYQMELSNLLKKGRKYEPIFVFKK